MRDCASGSSAMKAMCGKAALLALAVLVIAPAAQAQGVIDRNHVPSLERTDPLERRRDDIDGNNVRATITNWNQTAESGNPADFDYEWPKNTNRRYVALTQLWVGAETTANAGPDAGQPVWLMDVADFRGNTAGGNTSWTFEPIGGYVNPAGSDLGIAQSDERDSWPPDWPDKRGDVLDPGWRGSWNGFFGKDIFNADQEFFYKAGDDQYDRFRGTYQPDATDPSRFGLGTRDQHPDHGVDADTRRRCRLSDPRRKERRDGGSGQGRHFGVARGLRSRRLRR